MKVKKVFSVKSLSTAMVAGMLIIASCSKSDDAFNSNDTQNVNSESVSDSYTSETADIASSVVTNVSPSAYGGARVDGTISGLALVDGRLTNAIITVTPDANSTKDNPSGAITIDFGAGQTDPMGVIRKGLITITYSGLKTASNSWRQLGFTNYSRSSVMFDDGMTYKVTNVSDSAHAAITLHHELKGGKLTFPDNTTITRTADFNVVYDFIALTVTVEPSSVTPSATGTTRVSKSYSTTITSNIVYKASCLASMVYIPVTGGKSIAITGGFTYAIDYGDGSCDNTVKISVGGKSATITVNSDGN